MRLIKWIKKLLTLMKGSPGYRPHSSAEQFRRHTMLVSRSSGLSREEVEQLTPREFNRLVAEAADKLSRKDILDIMYGEVKPL